MKKILALFAMFLIPLVWADDFVPSDEEETGADTFVLDADNNATDITLQFGDILGKNLRWNDAQSRFDLNDTLRVSGNLEQDGNVLTLDAENVAGGADIDIVANQGSDNNGTLRYNSTDNKWEVSNDGGAFFALEPGNPQDDIFFAYDAIGGTVIGNFPTDIPFDTEVREDAAFSHDADSAEITINTAGQYLVDYQCTMDAIGTARYIVRHWLETDTGSGYSELAGTRTGSYHRTTNDAIDNGNIRRYAVFSAGDKLKAVAQADANGVIRTLADSCRMSIERLDNGNGLVGPQGPQGIQGIPGEDGTDGTNGAGWGTDGTTTTTTQNADVDGNLNVDGNLTVSSECGPYGIFWAERGTVSNNASWAMGNGQSPFGSPMGCAGRVTKFAATCTGSIGTSLNAVIRKNNVATACTVNIPAVSGQAVVTNCNETFTDTDVVGVYAGTEVGAWSECVGTFWVKYD